MSLSYRLSLAGTTPIKRVTERAFPDPDERSSLVSAGFKERYGFLVSVHAGRNGYFDAVSDQGSWEWEPETHVSIDFDMDKFSDLLWNVANVVAIVRRVLDTGDEDAAFIFNGDVLLLARFGGSLVKHRRETWWKHYRAADEALPG